MCRESFYGDDKSYIQSVILADRPFGGWRWEMDGNGGGTREEESVLDIENGSCKLLLVAGDLSHSQFYDAKSDCCIRDRIFDELYPI